MTTTRDQVELKARIHDAGMSFKDVSLALGMPYTTLVHKLAGMLPLTDAEHQRIVDVIEKHVQTTSQAA
jgi:hypothetical protein